MIDGLLDRRGTIIRNAITGDSAGGQLHNDLMVVAASNVPALATKFLRQELRGSANVEMMR